MALKVFEYKLLLVMNICAKFQQNWLDESGWKKKKTARFDLENHLTKIQQPR